MINIHDLAAQDVNNPIFLTTWQNTTNQDSVSLDWLPYIYQAQVAMTAADGQASGDILYFPNGTYFIGATLHILRGIHMIGEGIGNTILSIHKNTDPVFKDNSTDKNVVEQDGLIFHFPGTDRLIGKNYKKFIPPFPVYIPQATRDALLINLASGHNSSGYGATIEKLTIDGNGEMRHGAVEHIGLVTIQDCEIRNFKGNGIHLYAHVEGRHDLSLLYGQSPNGEISPPNSNHIDSQPVISNPFNIRLDKPATINLHNSFVEYMKVLLKANGYNNNNLPNSAILLDQFTNHQTTSPSNALEFFINQNSTNFSEVSLTQNPSEAIIEIDYTGNHTQVGSQKVYLEFTNQFIFTDPNTAQTTTIKYNPATPFVVTYKFFDQAFEYPFIRTNASTWRVFRTTIHDCIGHGIYTFNLDANAGMAQAVSCINNGKFGFYDDSNLGNTYLGCYAEGNLEGDYWSGLADSGVNVSYFVGCHSDNMASSRIGKPGVLIGGNIRLDELTQEEIAKERKVALNLKESGSFDLKHPLRFLNYDGVTLGEADSYAYLDFGLTPFNTPGKEAGVLLNFHNYNESATTNKTGASWHLLFDGVSKNWNFLANNGNPANHRIALAGNQASHQNREVEAGSIWFRNGYYLAAHENKTNGNYNKFIKINSSIPNPGDSSQPDLTNLILSYTFHGRKPKKGDILFNSVPVAGGYSGWVCVKDYIVNPVPPDTREEWLPFGLIES